MDACLVCLRGVAGSTAGRVARKTVGYADGGAFRRTGRSSVCNNVRSIQGSAVAEVVIMAAMLVFVIFPVFSSVMERHILLDKARLIRDSDDMTNISVYNALNAMSLGKVEVGFSDTKADEIFRELLCKNLRLDSGLNPMSSSVAEAQVEILSFEIYKEGFPITCRDGSTIVRPTVHSCINVPLKPALYRSVILNLLGRDHIDVIVHVDSEIPVNN